MTTDDLKYAVAVGVISGLTYLGICWYLRRYGGFDLDDAQTGEPEYEQSPNGRLKAVEDVSTGAD